MGWVESLLRRWARQSVKEMDQGVGYRGSSLGRMAATVAGWADGGPPPGVTACDLRELERCIEAMSAEDRRMLAVVYKVADGNKSEAARILDIPRKQLYKHLWVSYEAVRQHFARVQGRARHG